MTNAHQPFYVTGAEGIRLHSWAIEMYGGKPGIRDQGALASCLALPQTRIFGHEPYSGLADKAAAYAYFIAKNHPFVDGNKRAALLIAVHFLRKNGLVHIYDEDAIADAIEDVVEKKAGIDTLIALFRAT